MSELGIKGEFVITRNNFVSYPYMRVYCVAGLGWGPSDTRTHWGLQQVYSLFDIKAVHDSDRKWSPGCVNAAAKAEAELHDAVTKFTKPGKRISA